MIRKRLLSITLSLALAFGSAAALPEGVFTEQTEIKASAQKISEDNSTAVNIEAAATNFFENNNAKKRTQQQIIDYMNRHPFFNDSDNTEIQLFYPIHKDYYSVEPVFKNGQYVQGSLSTASLGYGLNALNTVRYIAGLGEVTLNSEYNDYAQAASLCNAANGTLSHYPDKPSGMSEELYEKGATGAGSSNIGMGYYSIANAMINGWMSDADCSNIDRVGHRRWCLNPSMGSTGFGHAGAYTAMYAFDRSATGSDYTVAWPAPVMPYQVFYPTDPWSVSKNSSFSQNTVVTLKRLTDSKTWTFSNSKSDGDFYISNNYYGQYGCVIFRPENAYHELYDQNVSSDKYNVTIVDGDYRLSYDVNFFDTYDEVGVTDSCLDNLSNKKKHLYDNGTVTKKATCTSEGKKIVKCTVCGKTATQTIKKLDHKCDKWTTVKKATCTTNGQKTAKCAVCGQKITQVIKATGHDWGNDFPSFDWNKDYSSATATFTCKKDKSHTKTLKAEVETISTIAPTCSKQGEKKCKASVSFNGYTYSISSRLRIYTIPHKFTAWKTTSFNVDKGTSTQKRTCSVCKKPETRTVKNAVVRYAGANRYDTAAMLSKASHKTTSDTVIIADAMTFQDALIAVPLAKAYNAPLLLANPNTVTKQTEAELARLKAKKVIIVNTNNALQKGTLDALKNKYSTQIINGRNCFETSKRVAEELQKKTKKAPTDVFFTTNKAFADALSISPVAALKGAPILYVDPTKKTLDSNILAYLNKVKGSIKNVYIVGGKVAVPTAIENSIKKALPKKNVKRFNGAQRYETCVMINKYFAKDLSSKTICIAKGLDFPDALAGGVFAANQKAPLLLADSALRDAHKSFLKDKKPNKLYIFGGKVAVPDKLAKEVAKMSV